MPGRAIYDNELHAHFLTFSCYRRRRLLDHAQAKRILLGVLDSQLQSRDGHCMGFVIMPDHVHAMVWFPVKAQLSVFVQQWKRMSSYHIQRFLRQDLVRYASLIQKGDPFWQRKYYSYNVFSEEKIREKLVYMHENPVRIGLVSTPCDWPWSSARHYEEEKSVGVRIRWPG